MAECYRCRGRGHFARDCTSQETEGRSCYRCGGVGHLACNCPSQGGFGGGGARAGRCYQCGDWGHFACECPNPGPLGDAGYEDDEEQEEEGSYYGGSSAGGDGYGYGYGGDAPSYGGHGGDGGCSGFRGARGGRRGNNMPSPFRPLHGVSPRDYGWEYQGCNVQSRVEFWEREGVRMDFYPTTGTVKTSMNHPTKGPTQMFRRDVPVDEFEWVLENPRAHTGRGYQTRRNMPRGGGY